MMTLFATLDCCVTTLSTKIADIFIKLNVFYAYWVQNECSLNSIFQVKRWIARIFLQICLVRRLNKRYQSFFARFIMMYFLTSICLKLFHGSFLFPWYYNSLMHNLQMSDHLILDTPLCFTKILTDSCFRVIKAISIQQCFLKKFFPTSFSKVIKLLNA